MPRDGEPVKMSGSNQPAAHGSQGCREIQVHDKRDTKLCVRRAHEDENRLAPPVDLSHYLSAITMYTNGSVFTKKVYIHFTPEMKNLAGSAPHASSFPFDTLEAKVALPQRFKRTPNEPDPEGCTEYDTVDDAPPPAASSARLIVPQESDTTNVGKRIDVATALQYGLADGYPPLLSFLRQFTRRNLHPNIPYAGGPAITLTCGNTDGLAKTLDALSNPWVEGRDYPPEKEGVLVESFLSPQSIHSIASRGLNVVSVRVDDGGMAVIGGGGLADVLKNWDSKQGKRPHLIYTRTIGNDPTGTILSVGRRCQIYALCQKYDVIIIEDEPYWHLQYPSASRLSAQHRGTNFERYPRNYNAGGQFSGFEFLDSLVPSYLSVDTEGRVVRLDSFSKIIGPGSRLGWLTAQPEIVKRIVGIAEKTTQQPSGFSQAMIAELIIGQQAKDATTKNAPRSDVGPGWKLDGFVRWLEGLRGDHEGRMQTMCNILEETKFFLQETVEKKHQQRPSRLPFGLGSGSSNIADSEWEVVHKVQMFDFSWPRGGMFVWLRTRLDTHPLHGVVDDKNLARALWKHLTKKPFLCMVAPGGMFSPNKKTAEETAAWQFFRVSFASLKTHDVADASRALAAGFKSFWMKTAPAQIDSDDDDDEN